MPIGIQPENILLPGGAVDVKVLDFGVAKLVAEPAVPPNRSAQRRAPTPTMAGTIIGTPAYMAPEQLRASSPGPRTDVFALGVIAYEMLTGDLLFGRGSLAEVVLAQAHGARRLRDVDAAIPPPLEAAVMRALSMNPEGRPASAHAFACEVRATS